MLSTHLIVDAAFFVGVALAFNPARKIIRRLLSSYNKKSNEDLEKAEALTERLNVMLKRVTPKHIEIDSHVDEILSLAEERCQAIFKKGKKDMEKMIEDNINLATEKIEMRIENFMRSLRLTAVDVAAGATHRLVREDIDGHSMGSRDSGSSASTGSDDNVVKKLH